MTEYKKFDIRATKVIHLRAVIEAESLDKAKEFLEGMIVSDFDETGTDFTAQYIVEISAEEAARIEAEQ